MKKWQVEKLVVVKLHYQCSAKDEAGAAKALQRIEEDLDMDLEYVLALDELGIFVKEVKPKAKPKPKKPKK